MEIVLVIAAFAAVAALFWGARFVMRRPRLRGASAPGAGLMSAGFDQVWQPQASEARDIIDAEQRLVVEAPAPDDDLGISRGSRL
ncbi:hypothetical protein M2152_002631 [Microbacteriaceae bacterium SG_E_30_P1]|uniref:Uncharacterized protein n=1 Tax=Antiquaquibacter oligotrophicus TaxID=2880260 RepID=A0ABT6KRG9_9MICO|nr:hypothetical protein [Antiquaquibacter oligotrophicus]MDH6182449.1 hypothetical protein [Antiquaquibacter oligotrophicus]UDF14580.1 hypothetical protein LH407_06880 [Antiquaquibacter oligotrophicus]